MASSLLRRLAVPIAVSIAAVCAAAVVALPAPAQAAVGTTEPAGAAAGWLARQLTDGNHFETDFGGTKYPDQGLTIDAALAFVAAGVAGDSLTKAVTWLQKPDVIGGYIGDGTTESYVGGTAKLAYLALVLGQDPTSFGGVDLTARLGDLLKPSGQYEDTSAYGDNSNTFGQSLAILALDRTSGGAPAPAVQFLAGTQCDDGGFPVFYGPCTTSDTDGTAYAVQALLAAGDTATAAEGLAWLVSQQDAGTGGLNGTGATKGLNANSTGLTAQAFRVSAMDSEADRAVAFLRTLQVGCAGPAEHTGAIALNPLDPAVPGSGFQPGNAPRATAQAVLGFVGVGLADLKLSDGIAPDAPTLTLSCANPVLPITGTSLSPMVLLGFGLLVVGTGLVALVRRRRT
jgi:LPXTG-motif cell wall-anchored protein